MSDTAISDVTTLSKQREHWELLVTGTSNRAVILEAHPLISLYSVAWCILLHGTLLYSVAWNTFVLCCMEHFYILLHGTLLCIYGALLYSVARNTIVFCCMEHFCILLHGTLLYSILLHGILFVFCYMEHFCILLLLYSVAWHNFVFCCMEHFSSTIYSSAL